MDSDPGGDSRSGDGPDAAARPTTVGHVHRDTRDETGHQHRQGRNERFDPQNQM